MPGLGRSGFSPAVGGGQVRLHLTSHRKYGLIGYICTTLFQKVRCARASLSLSLATGIMGGRIIVMYNPGEQELVELTVINIYGAAESTLGYGGTLEALPPCGDYGAGASAADFGNGALENGSIFENGEKEIV